MCGGGGKRWGGGGERTGLCPYLYDIDFIASCKSMWVLILKWNCILKLFKSHFCKYLKCQNQRELK